MLPPSTMKGVFSRRALLVRSILLPILDIQAEYLKKNETYE